MNLTTKKVLEEAIRGRKSDIVRLQHLEDTGELFDQRAADIAANEKMITDLRESIQILYDHAKR